MSTEEKYKNYISMSPTYTNNLREAQVLFFELKKITEQENHELLRDTIIDHYLLPHPTPPKAKNSETPSLNNQDIIRLPNNKGVLATTQLIQQHKFRKTLKTDRTNNITSKTFLIHPYKNFFGIKSSSLQNVILKINTDRHHTNHNPKKQDSYLDNDPIHSHKP